MKSEKLPWSEVAQIGLLGCRPIQGNISGHRDAHAQLAILFTNQPNRSRYSINFIVRRTNHQRVSVARIGIEIGLGDMRSTIMPRDFVDGIDGFKPFESTLRVSTQFLNRFPVVPWFLPLYLRQSDAL